MAGLYYSITVRGNESVDWMENCYRLPSPLPFVSPLNTDLFFAAEDFSDKLEDFSLYVVYHEHYLPMAESDSKPRGRREFGDFYMVLSQDRLEANGADPDVTFDHPEVFCRYLEKNGWEKV